MSASSRPRCSARGAGTSSGSSTCPTTRERTAIWDLVIAKYGREVTAYDTVVLARASELHTGAEIEAAFVEALHRGFTEDREPGELDLGESAQRVRSPGRCP